MKHKALTAFSEAPPAIEDTAVAPCDAAAGVAAGAVQGEVQTRAAPAEPSDEFDNRVATQDITWDAAAVDSTDAYDTTCSTYVGSSDAAPSGRHFRAETWIVLVRGSGLRAVNCCCNRGAYASSIFMIVYLDCSAALHSCC
jgi:hypothetical protein